MCWRQLQVADLQAALREEQIIVEEKKAQTDELIVSIGKEKAVVDEAVEAGREDEEAASKLQNEVQAFQEECTRDLAAGVMHQSCSARCQAHSTHCTQCSS
jgi:dynein heavy chain